MSRFSSRVGTLAVVMLALVATNATAGAQLPIPSVSAAGGISNYRLDGSGSAPFGALRVQIPLILFVAEGSVGVFRSSETGDVHRTYVIPEAQLQWQFFPTLVRPYVGVGGGWFRAMSGPDPHANDGTFSLSGGVRVGLPLTALGFRGEVRERSVGSGFSRRATEWTIGVSW